MNIRQALKKAGSQQALADVFAEGGKKTRVTRQAVVQWAAKGEIPPLRLYQLRELRPQWFEGK